MPRPTNWKLAGGAALLVAEILIGIGVIISGLSLANISCVAGSTCTSWSVSEMNFFNELESGIIIAGIGVMLLGVGMLLQSLQRPGA
jgi:hypothetical protein